MQVEMAILHKIKQIQEEIMSKGIHFKLYTAAPNPAAMAIIKSSNNPYLVTYRRADLAGFETISYIKLFYTIQDATIAAQSINRERYAGVRTVCFDILHPEEDFEKWIYNNYYNW